VGREAHPVKAPSVTAALLIAALGTLVLGLLPSWLVDVANAATLGQ
jgi:NADH:ubiquinone oxidoreductase subunit 2 (subunit N)